MVDERGVLGRVQDLEQGVGWVAAVGTAEFLDFVQEDHRVV